LALDLNFEDQVRSRHHVQVQSPISTARWYNTTSLLVLSRALTNASKYLK
jgi:hypothetical protein